ncbi:MAG: hypothetical protein AAF479_08785 [Pseudomonadota bacterium]
MPLFRMFAGLLLALMLCAPASAQAKSFRLSADPELIDNGTLKYLLPRFSLKTGVKIQIVEGEADARLAPEAEGPGMFQSTDGVVFRLSIQEGAAAEFAGRFRDWLTSDVGRRAIGKVRIDGAARYGAVEQVKLAVVEAAPTGDAVLGEEIALRRCGRCHVISKKNRMGGIGSTPSFGALKTLPAWRERFDAFWTLNPHPSFTQIEGITEPFDPQRPSPIAPVELTLDELEALMAYVISIKPKDLGKALIVQ